MAKALRDTFETLWSYLLPASGVLILFAAWQYMALGPVASSSLPTATETLQRLVDIVGSFEFWGAAADTALSSAIGFAIAIAIAIPVGALIGISEVLHRASRVLLEFWKPIPSIVMLPLVVLIVGINMQLAVVLIVLGVTPSLIVVIAAGARDTDPNLLDTGRTYQFSWLRRQRQIVLPSTLPFIVTSARIGVSFSLMTAVMAEIVGGAPGLGSVLQAYRRIGAADYVFAYVLAIGILGVAVNYWVYKVERWLLRAHPPMPGQPVRRRKPAKRWFGSGNPLEPNPWLDRIADQGSSVAIHWRERRRSTLWMNLSAKMSRLALPKSAKRWALLGLQVAVPIVLFIWWWKWSATAESIYFPSALSIMYRFQDIWLFDQFVSDVLPSLRNLVYGLGLATVVGIAVGILAGKIAWLGSMLEPIIGFFRSIPGVAFVPIMVTLLGFDTSMRISSIALASTFPVLLATLDGIRDVDSTLVDVGRSYRIGWFRTIRSIYLPASAPRIFAGLEVSLVVALVVMITSELLGTFHGIGSVTLRAQQTFDFTAMWSGIILLAFLGLASNMLFRVVRNFVLHWYDGAQRASRAQ